MDESPYAALRRMLSASLLLFAVGLSACTADEFWRGVYESGKKTCRNYPANCTDHPADDGARRY